MSDVREKRVELILQQLEELPTLPAVAVRVLEVTGDEGSSVKDVVRLIESDPALTARILQLVHRADVGVRGEVSSVERAVVLLGFEAVRSAVLAVSVFNTFAAKSERAIGPTPAAATNFNREDFWKHCIAVACCAELLAEMMQLGPRGERLPRSAPKSSNAIVPSEAFICGLLHDLGKLALDAVLPKSFGRVVEAAELLRGNIADVERTVIGLDHMVVGKRLAEKWQLPTVIRDCVWLHGQHPDALPATVRQPRLVNLVTLADLLVREQHLGFSGNYGFTVPRQALLEATGLIDQQVHAAMVKLVEQIEPRAKALGLGQVSSGELYQQALAQANRELGRVSGQLASKNRRLSIRAKFFDALSSFQGELRPDAPPQTVLHAVAQTAVAILGVNAVASFSLPPNQEFAEVLLCNEKGEVFENSLVDLPKGSGQWPVASGQTADEEAENGAAGSSSLATDHRPLTTSSVLRPAQPPPGDGPVLPCGDDLEWLVSAISPRLPHEHRYWICLEADGLCVGGVVWGAPAGEAQRLSTQAQELVALANGWSLALRTAQIREEARALSEALAEANRQLHTAQSEILRSKMMISIGEMAAGAAHEMNNPLAVISGRSQLLASQLSDPKHKAAAHLIYEQSHRLSSIITELMDFAKPQPPHPAEVELAEVVERALHEAKMHAESADRDIEVTMGDVPPVVVDVRQVGAALAEVIDNALQATEPNPNVPPAPPAGHVAVHAAFDPYSSRVVVTVSDTGHGMDEQTLKRAFDPFFSSKPAGRRRGMGLAKALRWVEASGGSIRLESRPGQGTRTILLLPAAKPDAAAANAAEVRPPERKVAP